MNKQYISNDLADKTLHLKLMNMRKSIILLAFILGGFTVANAQSVVEGTKLTDNWSVGVNAGGVTPLTHSAFFKGMRPTFGVGVSKQLTPIFGLGFQGMGYGLLPMLSGVAELVGRGIMAIVASNKKSYTMACMASPFAWIVATVLLIGLYFYVMKDMKRRLGL